MASLLEILFNWKGQGAEKVNRQLKETDANTKKVAASMKQMNAAQKQVAASAQAVSKSQQFVFGAAQLNQALELQGRIKGISKAMLDFARSGAKTKGQIAVFKRFDSSVKGLGESFARATAAGLQTSGVLDAMADRANALSNAVTTLTTKIGGETEGLGEAIIDTVNPLSNMIGVIEEGGVVLGITEEATKSVTVALRKEGLALKKSAEEWKKHNIEVAKAALILDPFEKELFDLEAAVAKAQREKAEKEQQKRIDATLKEMGLLTGKAEEQVDAVWSLNTNWSMLADTMERAGRAAVDIASTDVLGIGAGLGAGATGAGVGGRFGVLGAAMGAQAGAEAGAEAGPALIMAERADAIERLGMASETAEMQVAQLAAQFDRTNPNSLAAGMWTAVAGLNAGTQALGRNAKAIALFSKAAKAGTREYAGLGAAAVDVAGSTALGVVEGERTKAGILTVMETAKSIADFASGNLIGGAGHAAAAIQFGLIAGGALGRGASEARPGASSGSIGAGIAASEAAASASVATGRDRPVGGEEQGRSSTEVLVIPTTGESVMRVVNADVSLGTGIRFDPASFADAQGVGEV
jgi:hypothetical protein